MERWHLIVLNQGWIADMNGCYQLECKDLVVQIKSSAYSRVISVTGVILQS